MSLSSQVELMRKKGSVSPELVLAAEEIPEVAVLASSQRHTTNTTPSAEAGFSTPKRNLRIEIDDVCSVMRTPASAASTIAEDEDSSYDTLGNRQSSTMIDLVSQPAVSSSLLKSAHTRTRSEYSGLADISGEFLGELRNAHPPPLLRTSASRTIPNDSGTNVPKSPTRKYPNQNSNERNSQRDALSSKSRTMFLSKKRPKLKKSHKSWAQAVADARAKVPINGRRYLHKVHWLSDGSREREAFLGWINEDLMPNRRATVMTSAVQSPLGYTAEVFTIRPTVKSETTSPPMELVKSPCSVIPSIAGSNGGSIPSGVDFMGDYKPVPSISHDQPIICATVPATNRPRGGSLGNPSALSVSIAASQQMTVNPTKSAHSRTVSLGMEQVQRMSSFEMEDHMLTVTNNCDLFDHENQTFVFSEKDRNWKGKLTSNSSNIQNNAGSYCPPSSLNSSSMSSTSITTKARRIVFMDMKLKRLSDIDTSRLTFRCKFHFYLTWMAKYEEVQDWYLWKSRSDWDKQTGNEQREWIPDWFPVIELINAVDIYKLERDSPFKLKPGHDRSFLLIGSNKYSWDILPSELGCDPRDAFWIRVKYDCDISFSEELELSAFPFDCQSLSMFLKLASDPITRADLVPFPRSGEFILLDSQFSILSEWTIHNVISEWKSTDPTRSKALTCYPMVGIHIKVSRKWSAYLFFLTVTICMQTLGLCSFSINNHDMIGERLSYCVTLLLADVTLLQLMFQELPNISYVTILDLFMWNCFIFLFLVTIWSSLIDVHHIDRLGFIIFSLVYTVTVLLFLITAVHIRYNEFDKLNQLNDNSEQNDASVCNDYCSFRCCQKMNYHCCESNDSRDSIVQSWNRLEVFDDHHYHHKSIVSKGHRITHQL